MIHAIYSHLSLQWTNREITSTTHQLLEQLKERLSAEPVERREIHIDTWELEEHEAWLTWDLKNS